MLSTLVSQISDSREWWLSLLLGATIVVIYSYSRFDEPSYGELKYFARYELRFSTSHGAYQRWKYAYTLLVTLIFIVFAMLIQWARKGTGGGATPLPSQELSSPIAIAMYIISLTSLPYLQKGELLLRGMFHAWAKIPHAVRQTFGEMDASQFNHNFLESERQRISETEAASFSLGTQNVQNEILRLWLKMGSLLNSLSNKPFQLLKGENLDFFVHYKDEFDDIKVQHDVIGNSLQRYLGHKKPSASQEQDAREFLSHLKELDKRLLTFIACLVRSSVATDVESGHILQQLGFVTESNPVSASNTSDMLLWLSVPLILPLGAVLVLTPIAVKYIDHSVRDVFKLPAAFDETFIWFCVSAATYIVVLSISLRMRAELIGRNEWFELNDNNKHRPWKKYLPLAAYGMVGGAAVLVILGLSCIAPALAGCLNAAHDLSTSATFIKINLFAAIPWLPVYLGIAFAGLWVSDTADMSDESSTPWAKFANQSIRSGIIIAGLAAAALFIRDDFPKAAYWSDFVIVFAYIPFQIFLLSGTMLFSWQIYIYSGDIIRPLAGKHVHVHASEAQGDDFVMVLECNGEATRYLSSKEQDADSHGQWVHFPEGTVIHWDDKGDKQAGLDGEVGLIKSSNGILFYHAFRESIAGKPDSSAQLNIIANPFCPVARL